MTELGGIAAFLRRCLIEIFWGGITMEKLTPKPGVTIALGIRYGGVNQPLAPREDFESLYGRSIKFTDKRRGPRHRFSPGDERKPKAPAAFSTDALDKNHVQWVRKSGRPQFVAVNCPQLLRISQMLMQEDLSGLGEFYEELTDILQDPKFAGVVRCRVTATGVDPARKNLGIFVKIEGQGTTFTLPNLLFAGYKSVFQKSR